MGVRRSSLRIMGALSHSHIPEVGVVVGGTLTSGTLKEGDRVQVGPSDKCQFTSGHVTSIHRYWSPCRLVKAGQAATLALNGIERPLCRKGMVILDPHFAPKDTARSTWKFSANIFLLHHTGSGVRKGFQSTLYVASVMQTVIVEEIEGEEETLSQGQKGCVHFRFQRHPEFLRTGWRLLFRDGQTRGMGEITKLIHCDTQQLYNKRSPSPHR